MVQLIRKWALGPWARLLVCSPSPYLVQVPNYCNVYHWSKVGQYKWLRDEIWLKKKSTSFSPPISRRGNLLYSCNDRSIGITSLVNRCLNATCTLVLSDPAGRLCVLDVIINNKAFRLIGVYGPNDPSELPDFFRRLKPFVMSSKRVILVLDWNAVFDPCLDRGGTNQATNYLDAKYCGEFVAWLNLVDEFLERHPTKVEWTWISRGVSGLLSSYLNRVLGEST